MTFNLLIHQQYNQTNSKNPRGQIGCSLWGTAFEPTVTKQGEKKQDSCTQSDEQDGGKAQGFTVEVSQGFFSREKMTVNNLQMEPIKKEAKLPSDDQDVIFVGPFFTPVICQGIKKENKSQTGEEKEGVGPDISDNLMVLKEN